MELGQECLCAWFLQNTCWARFPTNRAAQYYLAFLKISATAHKTELAAQPMRRNMNMDAILAVRVTYLCSHGTFR